MRRLVLLICVLSIFLLALPVNAVNVDVIPSHGDIPAKEKAWYTIEIQNDYPMADNFVITVIGPHLEWLNLGAYYIKMNANEKKEIDMFFYPDEIGTYDYTVLVYSNRDNKIKDSDTVSLKVLPERPVKLLSFSAERIGNNLEVFMEFATAEERNLDIYFEVMSSAEKRVGYTEFKEVVDGKVEITRIMELGELDSDEYELRMGIPEFGVTANTGFLVAPIHKVVTKKEIVSTPFGDEVTITLTNQGNVVEDYAVSETLENSQYVEFDEEPIGIHLEDDGISYNWVIEGMAIGATEEISYTISRIPLLVGSFIVVFCVIALLGMGTVKVRAPNIKKKYIKKGNDHLIILEIRGPMAKTLNNVLVKDRVSPLGKVMPEFDGPKPVVRESETGTELIWRIGDMKPRSEIFLTYKIKPLIDAQQLKMPRAHLTYRTADERKINVFSKQIVLE